MIRAERLRTDVPAWAVAVAALGLVALASRWVGLSAPLVVALVGLAGITAAVPTRGETPSAARWVSVALLGTAAVAAVALGSRTYSVHWYPAGAVAAVVAAVAEEAFFRRFLYGWLARWGPSVAVVVTAIAFAAVHVPVYGAETLALNAAAGLLFGWQRWAGGTWTAPAATHAAANLLAFL